MKFDELSQDNRSLAKNYSAIRLSFADEHDPGFMILQISRWVDSPVDSDFD